MLGPGVHTGVMSKREAQRKASMLKLDLVEVSPHADPPVVRIMDFGKYLFDEKKTKKKQKVQKIKVIQLRPMTDEGDYQVKMRNLIRFLQEGDKVRVVIRFRGREITHKELGNRLLDRLKGDVASYGQVETEGRLDGRQMIMVVVPKKGS